ncbi:hypothetical protein ACFL26_00100 [Patescibacteria group bacterium]
MDPTSVRLRLFFAAFAVAGLVTTGYITFEGLTFTESIRLAAGDPAVLTAAYLIAVGLIGTFLLVFSPRGFWWSLIDAICAAGALSLALSPLLGWAAGSVWTGLALAATGSASLAGCIALYRWGKDRPVIRLFGQDDHHQDDDPHD